MNSSVATLDCKPRWTEGNADFDHQLLDQRECFEPGDIDGGFGASFCAAHSGPGLHPVHFDTQAFVGSQAVHPQEIRLGIDTEGPLSWQVGGFLFSTVISMSPPSAFDFPAAGHRQPHQRSLGAVRSGQLRIDRKPVLRHWWPCCYTDD